MPAYEDAQALATDIFNAVFLNYGETQRSLARCWLEGDLADIFRLHARPESALWAEFPPDHFFDVRTFQRLHRQFQSLDPEERDLLAQTVQRLVEVAPHEVVALGASVVDFVRVLLVMAWTLDPEAAPYPFN